MAKAGIWITSLVLHCPLSPLVWQLDTLAIHVRFVYFYNL